MGRSSENPRPYLVHVNDASDIVRQLPGYSAPEPRQWSVEARALAARRLDSHGDTHSLPPAVRAPAETFVLQAIRAAATEAHEDVFHFAYNTIAVEALGSAESTRRLPDQIRPQMEGYVRDAIDDAADRSHGVILAWRHGASADQVPAVAEFLEHLVTTYRARQTLGASPPAHLATVRDRSEPARGETASAVEPLGDDAQAIRRASTGRSFGRSARGFGGQETRSLAL